MSQGEGSGISYDEIETPQILSNHLLVSIVETPIGPRKAQEGTLI